MPGYGLSEAVRNALEIHYMKKDRKEEQRRQMLAEARQTAIDKQNEEDRQYYRERYEREKREPRRYLNQGEEISVYPGSQPTAGIGPAQEDRVAKQKLYEPEPKTAEVGPGNTLGTVVGGKFTSLYTAPDKPVKGEDEPKVSFRTKDGLTVSGPYSQVQPYLKSFDIDKSGGGEKYSKAQALDDARSSLGGGPLTLTQEIANMKAQESGMDIPYKGKNISLQELQPKADSLYNMQNYGQWDNPMPGMLGAEQANPADFAGQDGDTSGAPLGMIGGEQGGDADPQVAELQDAGYTRADLDDPETAAYLASIGYDVETAKQSWDATSQ